MPALSLERVLRELHDSQINAGLQTVYDDGMQVWISDQMNSRRAETSISRQGVPGAWPEEGLAARWLHETALSMFPDSAYAKTHGG